MNFFHFVKQSNLSNASSNALKIRDQKTSEQDDESDQTFMVKFWCLTLVFNTVIILLWTKCDWYLKSTEGHMQLCLAQENQTVFIS